MKSSHQIIRSPIKSILGLVLACLSCASLCLCAGQFYSAVRTRDNIEHEFTTIALPNIDEATKGPAFLESVSRTQEIEQYLANLSDRYPEDVLSTENFYQTNAVADISAINIDASNEFVKNEFFDTDPRRGNLAESILYIRIDEIGEINSEWTDLYRDMYSQMGLPEDQAPNFGLECEITGTVLKAVALNGSYPDPSGRRARITFRFTDMDTFERYGLEPGMNCLVFGVDYKDDDRTLRRRIAVHAAAGINDLYLDADLSRIREMSEEDILTYKKMNPKAEELPKYEYVRGSGKGIPLKPSEYDMMNRVSLTVSENIMVSSGEAGKETHTLVSGDEITASEYIEQYGFPGLSVIEGDLDEYLKSADGEIWRTWAEVIDIESCSFPIISVANIGAVAQFASEEAFLVEGRLFSKKEYADQSRVCIISESLAAKNGLKLGDMVSLQFYDQDKNYSGHCERMIERKKSNPLAGYYSPVLGFCSEKEPFEVVGIYRQKEQWGYGNYDFTPNTIFVPEGTEKGTVDTYFYYFYSSIVLKNGSIDRVEEHLKDDGMNGLLVYYDRGYTDIKPSVDEYFKVSPGILAAGIAAWLILTAAFVYMFVIQRKQDALRMTCLGTEKSAVVKHLFSGGFTVALAGIVIGAVLSLVFMEKIIKVLVSSIGSETALSPVVSNPVVIITALCDIAVTAIIIYITSVIVSKNTSV